MALQMGGWRSGARAGGDSRDPENTPIARGWQAEFPHPNPKPSFPHGAQWHRGIPPSPQTCGWAGPRRRRAAGWTVRRPAGASSSAAPAAETRPGPGGSRTAAAPWRPLRRTPPKPGCGCRPWGWTQSGVLRVAPSVGCMRNDHTCTPVSRVICVTSRALTAVSPISPF